MEGNNGWSNGQKWPGRRAEGPGASRLLGAFEMDDARILGGGEALAQLHVREPARQPHLGRAWREGLMEGLMERKGRSRGRHTSPILYRTTKAFW